MEVVEQPQPRHSEVLERLWHPPEEDTTEHSPIQGAHIKSMNLSSYLPYKCMIVCELCSIIVQ